MDRPMSCIMGGEREQEKILWDRLQGNINMRKGEDKEENPHSDSEKKPRDRRNQN